MANDCAVIQGLNTLIKNFTEKFGHVPIGLVVSVEIFEHLVEDHSLSKKPVDSYKDFLYKDIPVYMSMTGGACTALMQPRDISTYRKLEEKEFEEFKKQNASMFEQEDSDIDTELH